MSAKHFGPEWNYLKYFHVIIYKLHVTIFYRDKKWSFCLQIFLANAMWICSHLRKKYLTMNFTFLFYFISFFCSAFVPQFNPFRWNIGEKIQENVLIFLRSKKTSKTNVWIKQKPLNWFTEEISFLVSMW